jgi:uncharacterized protein
VEAFERMQRSQATGADWDAEARDGAGEESRPSGAKPSAPLTERFNTPVYQYRRGPSFSPSEGLLQDHDELAHWFRLATEPGSAVAQYNLGVAYALGDGVVRDDEEAARWFRLAAEQGCTDARHRLEDLQKGGARSRPS